MIFGVTWPEFLAICLFAGTMVYAIHTFFYLAFLSKLMRRLREWPAGRRCNCGKPKRDPRERKLSPGNAFEYCVNCDAFYYNEKVAKEGWRL